jgi:hypothetical protein
MNLLKHNSYNIIEPSLWRQIYRSLNSVTYLNIRDGVDLRIDEQVVEEVCDAINSN